MILLVALDLKQAATSYTELYDALKAKESWWHYMRTTWLVATEDTPQDIVDEIKPFLQSGDRALVTRLTNPYQGWLPTKAWDWIRRHMAEEDDN